MENILLFKTMASPVGDIRLVAGEKGLVAILWENDDPKRVRLQNLVEDNDHAILVTVEKQLNEYFNGSRSIFEVPLDLRGTPFQVKVWEALLTIPFGETRTYGQIAEQIGNPKSVRAVGAANGKNPISIIAPCHRVIGASGKLTGFAGGLHNKAILLRIENNKYTGNEVDQYCGTAQLELPL
jgi:methylated-DNA-[protein]-cysteine S-methyltransferase